MPADTVAIVKRFFPDVERVKDASSSVSVTVTKADANAIVKSHKDCAMARACRRGLDLDGAVISRSIAYLVKGDVATRYRVPEAVAREIVAFDRGAGFAPGEYELQKPGVTYALGKDQKPHTQRRTTGNRTGKPNPKGKPRHQTAGLRTNLLATV